MKMADIAAALRNHNPRTQNANSLYNFDQQAQGKRPTLLDPVPRWQQQRTPPPPPQHPVPPPSGGSGYGGSDSGGSSSGAPAAPTPPQPLSAHPHFADPANVAPPPGYSMYRPGSAGNWGIIPDNPADWGRPGYAKPTPPPQYYSARLPGVMRDNASTMVDADIAFDPWTQINGQYIPQSYSLYLPVPDHVGP